jgi:hypothetical protein
MKAVNVLNSTIGKIKLVHERYTELRKKLTKYQKNTNAQLDEEVERFKRRLTAECSRAIEKFKKNMREDIYKEIDKGIGNKKFEATLNRHFEENVKQLQGILDYNFNNVISEFENEITKIANKFQKHIEELRASYINSGKFDGNFKLNINIKSGIKLAGLLISLTLSIVSIILLIITGGGAFLAWGTLATSQFAIWKSLPKTLNRKSQQKMLTNKCIDEEADKIHKSIKNKLGKANRKLESGMGNIKKELAKVINHTDATIEVFADAELKLTRLAFIVNKTTKPKRGK